MRVHQNLILSQVVKRGHRSQVQSVDRNVLELQSREPGLNALACVRPMPAVELAVPLIVVIRDDGDVSSRSAANHTLRKRFKLAPNLCSLCHASVGAVMVIVDAVPVDLCAHRGGAPAKIEHHVGAMGNRLVGPEAHLSWLRRRLCQPICPPTRTRLLLHYAEIGRDTAHHAQKPTPAAITQRIGRKVGNQAA